MLLEYINELWILPEDVVWLAERHISQVTSESCFINENLNFLILQKLRNFHAQSLKLRQNREEIRLSICE